MKIIAVLGALCLSIGTLPLTTLAQARPSSVALETASAGVALDGANQATDVPKKRVALLIGIDDYDRLPRLTNAIRDATDVAEALQDIGFVIVSPPSGEQLVWQNVSRHELGQAVEALVRRVEPGDVAFVYFAGHGLQINGENYLIPGDWVGRDAVDAPNAAVAVNTIRTRLESSAAAHRILVLDACRQSAFERVSPGLAGQVPLTKPGTLLVFAAAPGQVAADLPGASNGLFAKHLKNALLPAENVESGGRIKTIDEIFNEVRAAVVQESKGSQIPIAVSALIGAELSLMPSGVGLRITTDTDADIYIDGKYVGHVGVSSPLSVRLTSKHLVRAVALRQKRTSETVVDFTGAPESRNIRLTFAPTVEPRARPCKAPPPEGRVAAVCDALERYVSAYESLSESKVREVYPRLAKGAADFDGVKAMAVQMECGQVSFVEDRVASVECTVAYKAKYEGVNGPPEPSVRYTIELEEDSKRAGKYLIRAMRVRFAH